MSTWWEPMETLRPPSGSIRIECADVVTIDEGGRATYKQFVQAKLDAGWRIAQICQSERKCELGNAYVLETRPSGPVEYWLTPPRETS